MTKLPRIVTKKQNKTEAPNGRTAIGSLAGTVGVACNLVLFLGKLLLGLSVGAVSIVADALNNLTDASSSVITLLGFRLASRPADRNHPYGHARYEYLSGLAVAAFIMVIGAELVINSVSRIFNPTVVEISAVSLVLLLCAAAVKLWMCFFYRHLGRKIDSPSLKAASVDSRNDVIATSAVFVGCIASRVWNINIDGWVGLAVAVFIFVSGIKLARETVSPLIGKRADPQLVERIGQIILSHDKILGIHDLLLHDYGPGQCFASVHVEMSADEDPLACHDIIDDIECDLLEQLNVHLVIHYDPVVTDDREWNDLRCAVSQIVAQIDPALSIHDFRMVKGAEQTKLVFDLAIPYAMTGRYRELKQRIDEALQSKGISYPAVIRFEGSSE